jgi:DNA-directed RNA polymerase specialized sigma24 family protein
MISAEPITVKYDGVFTDKEIGIMKYFAVRAKEKYFSLRNEPLDDIMQQLALKAYKAKERFIARDKKNTAIKNKMSYCTFLRLITRQNISSIVKGFLRHKRIVESYQADIEQLEPFLHAPEQDTGYMLDVRAVIEKLPEYLKETILLLLKGFNCQETGKFLGLHQCTVRRKVQEARKLYNNNMSGGGGISICLI